MCFYQSVFDVDNKWNIEKKNPAAKLHRKSDNEINSVRFIESPKVIGIDRFKTVEFALSAIWHINSTAKRHACSILFALERLCNNLI